MHIATEFRNFSLPARCLFIYLLIYLSIYLFVAYLITLSVAYTIWRRMSGGYCSNDVERFMGNLKWPEFMY